MPEISIIIPVYKVESILSRCIKSIIVQSFSDFELILVDDGSPDNSGKICDMYANLDSRIKVVHQKNSGASVARNTGIKLAKGKYIGFVDSDDYVSEKYLSALISSAEENNADIVMCNFVCVDENDSVTEMSHGFAEGTVFDREKIRSIIYKNIFSNKNTVGYYALWNKLFKRDLIKDNNISLNASMSFGEDMLFVLNCLRLCKSIAFTENKGYYYKMTPEGLFSKYRRSFVNDISICYNALIAYTAPKNYTNEDLIPLALKYWGYVGRQIDGVVDNEQHIFLQIRQVFKNKTVRSIFSVMSRLTDKQASSLSVAQNELKPARLLSRGLVSCAAFIADYQFNEKFWLRRLRG